MGTTAAVRLAAPALPEFLRLARVTAAGRASRLGFSFDEVEDLRLAIDELCYGVTGSTGRDGTVNVRFVLGPGSLRIEGSGHFSEGEAATDFALSELSEVILTALVDEHELSSGSDGPTFHLLKRRAAGAAP